MLSVGFVCELMLFARLAVTEEEIQGGEEAGKGKSHWSGPFVFWAHIAVHFQWSVFLPFAYAVI